MSSESNGDVRLNGLNRISRMFCLVTAFAAIICLTGLILSYFGRYWHFAELVSNFRFQLTIGLLVLVPALVAFRFRWFPILLFVFVSFSSGTFVQDYWKPKQDSISHTNNEIFSVMSFNILGTNRNVNDVLALVREADPDVLAILEYSNSWSRDLEAIHDRYPYRVLESRSNGFGVGLFSKFPFSQSNVVQLARDKTDSSMIVVEILFGGQPIRVAACHLLAPMEPYKMDIRTQEMHEIPAHLPYSDVPTILVGDFNCVPWSPFLTDLLNTTHLRDSRAGFGYQGSWPSGFWPMRIPIDHAFVSKHITIVDRSLLESAGSDHFPLLINFSVQSTRLESQPEIEPDPAQKLN